MKKGTKILLACLAGLTLVSSVGLGITLVNDNLSGTIVENPTEGPGKYDWRKHDVNISMDDIDENKYYSNNGDDHIYNLNICRSKKAIGDYYFLIYYNQSFKFYNDLQVFFILKRGDITYKTEVETSHNSIGLDEVKMPDEDEYGISMKYYNIREIWIRTVR